MPAGCNCPGATCGCKVTGTSSVGVTGTGTAQDPYVISLGTLNIGSNFVVDDTPTVDLTLAGTGTALDPLVLSAAVKVGATVTSTPTTGGTTAIDSATRTQVLNHVATIATQTITLPATSSVLESEIKIIAASAITALTVSATAGTTLGAGFPTALTAGQAFRAQLIGTVWRRV